MRQKILKKALSLYNQNGIEYVGMRELAGELNVKLGNITYYYKKKEDLVYEIWKMLSQSNSEIIAASNFSDLEAYINFSKKYFENQYKYRCLLWSFVHAIYQNSKIAKNYQGHIDKRNNVMLDIIELLIENGDIRQLTANEKEYLSKVKIIIFRHWIMEAKIASPKEKLSNLIQNNQRLLLSLLLPFYTEKGLKARNKIEASFVVE